MTKLQKNFKTGKYNTTKQDYILILFKIKNYILNNHFFDFFLTAYPKDDNTNFTIKGKGTASVLIITHFPEESKEEDFTFMANVLKAANLTPIDDKIFHLQVQKQDVDISLANIIRQLDVKNILIFGFKPQHLGIRAHLTPYQFVELNNKHILWGHSITTIREERAAKKNQKAAALWQALKGRFLG